MINLLLLLLLGKAIVSTIHLILDERIVQLLDGHGSLLLLLLLLHGHWLLRLAQELRHIRLHDDVGLGSARLLLIVERSLLHLNRLLPLLFGTRGEDKIGRLQLVFFGLLDSRSMGHRAHLLLLATLHGYLHVLGCRRLRIYQLLQHVHHLSGFTILLAHLLLLQRRLLYRRQYVRGDAHWLVLFESDDTLQLFKVQLARLLLRHR